MTNPNYEALAVDIRCGDCRGHVLAIKPPYWQCTSCHQKYTLRELNTYRYLVLMGEPSLEEKVAEDREARHFSVVLEKKNDKDIPNPD